MNTSDGYRPGRDDIIAMVPTGGGEVAGIGLEILILDEDGRIKTDHQFIEG